MLLMFVFRSEWVKMSSSHDPDTEIRLECVTEADEGLQMMHVSVLIQALSLVPLR